MRNLVRQLSIGVTAIAAVAAAGCQSSPPAGSSGTDTTVDTTVEADQATTEAVEPAPEPATDQPAEADTAASQWAMPNLVGTTLQDAQDQIQALTDGAIFYSASHDLSGKDRNQILDANWQVCSQNIAAGSPITSASDIDLGAVKISETCP